MAKILLLGIFFFTDIRSKLAAASSRSSPLLTPRLREAQHDPGVLTREKRSSVHDHYTDDHCEGHFQVESNTIIRTEDSQNMGASFLNETQVMSLSRCLHYCCSYPLCNVAVFDNRMESSEGGSCYLFDCGSTDSLKCQFTANSDFSSGVLDIDRHRFDLAAAGQQLDHSNQLEMLRGREEEQEQVECGRYQFHCHSGECIAIYDTCNGIPQCKDGSDEEPSVCPASSTQPPPPKHLHLRPDMDPIPPGQDSAFRHKSSGFQIPDSNYRGPWNNQQFQGFPDARRPSQSGPGTMADYIYPQDPLNSNNNVMNSQRGSLGPDFVYQNPSRNSLQPPSAYMGMPQYPQPQYQPQYPPQYQQPYPPYQQQQPPVFQNPQQTLPNKTEVKTTSVAPTTKSTTEKIKTTTPLVTTTMSAEEKFEADLIAELGDQLRPMETPGIAIFTLTVGVLLTTFLCVVVICRIRRGKMGLRRGLAHDADGDYLVNGMYL
eukprot:TRINITY_DN6626_c0_g1_i1.p1 TRINITY_DN6626_c0_g1~~TRINITY_DN6626_c0_g1_i1.p1  ORF type:complete len:487 (-),score=81.62 TRINITY_DN6626_c0_g1_i1:105-1565(-)